MICQGACFRLWLGESTTGHSGLCWIAEKGYVWPPRVFLGAARPGVGFDCRSLHRVPGWPCLWLSWQLGRIKGFLFEPSTAVHKRLSSVWVFKTFYFQLLNSACFDLWLLGYIYSLWGGWTWGGWTWTQIMFKTFFSFKHDLL